MNDAEKKQAYHQRLGEQLELYCKKYSIPLDHLFEILNDQKVVPMIRGKGMEYDVYRILQNVLEPNEWSVAKLNLSAQPGTPDQDISITHKRTGIILIAESKSAVRGSMRSGVKTRKHKVPHFQVKSHRSRSNMKLATTGNDRYTTNDFDILVTNTSNAIYEGGTVGDNFEIVPDLELLEILKQHYGVTNREELIEATLHDWRFVLPADIAENGLIPRTPSVFLQDDPHWRPIAELPNRVAEVVRQRVADKRSRRNS